MYRDLIVFLAVAKKGLTELHSYFVSLICAAELGDLDKVKSIVKLVGFVNCVDGFGGQVCIHLIYI
jgi:hypothetical protein